MGDWRVKFERVSKSTGVTLQKAITIQGESKAEALGRGMWIIAKFAELAAGRYDYYIVEVA